jgi:hypothetical protein
VFWTKLEGFEEAVKAGWTFDDAISDPFLRLNELLRNTAKHLQSWGQKKVGNIKLQIAIANLLIFRFDQAQDRRRLSLEEIWLRKMIKQMVLGLSSLERTIARQRSRMRWLRDGDASTKLFHTVANGRRVKNFIPSIKVGQMVITDQTGKEQAFFLAYNNLLGSIQNREHTLDLHELGLPALNLADLDDDFTEAEVWEAIKEMPLDRAPGTDGFIGAFYRVAWPWIKADVMATLGKLRRGDGRCFGKLNSALICLIPKKGCN